MSSSSQRTYCGSTTKTSHLMVFRKIIAIYSVYHTGQNAELFNVELCGIVTTSRESVTAFWRHLDKYSYVYRISRKVRTRSSSCEANCSSASNEIAWHLWKPKVPYRAHKNPLLISALSQINSVHIVTSCFLKIHFNIIYPASHWSPKWPLTFRFTSLSFVPVFHV